MILPTILQVIEMDSRKAMLTTLCATYFLAVNIKDVWSGLLDFPAARFVPSDEKANERDVSYSLKWILWWNVQPLGTGTSAHKDTINNAVVCLYLDSKCRVLTREGFIKQGLGVRSTIWPVFVKLTTTANYCKLLQKKSLLHHKWHFHCKWTLHNKGVFSE